MLKMMLANKKYFEIFIVAIVAIYRKHGFIRGVDLPVDGFKISVNPHLGIGSLCDDEGYLKYVTDNPTITQAEIERLLEMYPSFDADFNAITGTASPL